MNFLAHAYLSGDSQSLLIGNFIADSVKGSAIENFSEEIKKGILLHRSIDQFTDEHRIVRQSKERLYKNYHKYAGVLVDIFYDHFLAKNWKHYSSIELKQFANNVYNVMHSNFKNLPLQTKQILPYMIRYDWLSNYAHLQGIQQVLHGMAQRTRFVSNMEKAAIDLENNYKLFEQEFMLFFPDLCEHCRIYIK